MLCYLLELHDTKTTAVLQTRKTGLYYLLELHDTKTGGGIQSTLVCYITF